MKKRYNFANRNKRLRGGAEVAHWAHNPKVVGSNPAPATKVREVRKRTSLFL